MDNAREGVKMEMWRTKGGAPFTARGKDKSTIPQEVLAVKDNYVVIRMDLAGLTQWGSSWRRESVCGRAGFERIVEICGKSKGQRRLTVDSSRLEVKTLVIGFQAQSEHFWFAPANCVRIPY